MQSSKKLDARAFSPSVVAALLCHSRQRVEELMEYPAEVLSIICRELDGKEIARLWSCGDLKFNSRLAHGGVVELSFYSNQCGLGAYKYTLMRWPSLIRRFGGLRRLIIDLGAFASNVRVGMLGVSHKDLSCLPQSLVHLELRFDLTPSSFYPDEEEKSLETISYASSPYTSNKQSNPWVKSRVFERLVNLETLIVHGSHNLCQERDLKFPSSLRTLELHSSHHSINPTHLSVPRGLTRLIVGTTSVFSTYWLSNLPSTLEFLSLPHLATLQRSSTEAPLTPSLTELHLVSCRDLSPSYVKNNLPNLKTLFAPQSIENWDPSQYVDCISVLKLRGAPESYLVHPLPARLMGVSVSDPNLVKVLSVGPCVPSGSGSGFTTRDGVDLQELTKPAEEKSTHCSQLETLYLEFSNSIEQQLCAFIPRSVTNLSAKCRLDGAGVALLPRGLTSLTVNLELSEDLVLALPPSLITLSAFLEYEKREALRHLPPSLRHFRLGMSIPSESQIDLDHLPNNLTSLSLWTSNTNIRPVESLKLPGKLLKLDLGFELDELVKISFPATLTSFTFQSKRFSRILEMLPSTLLHLTIHPSIGGDDPLTLETIRQLPRSLRLLHLSYPSELDNSQVSAQDKIGTDFDLNVSPLDFPPNLFIFTVPLSAPKLAILQAALENVIVTAQ